MSDFISEIMIKLVQDFNNRVKPTHSDFKEFKLEPKISSEMVSKAWNYYLSSENWFQFNNAHCVLKTFETSPINEEQQQEIQDYIGRLEPATYETFEQYRRFHASYYHLWFQNSEWRCSCSQCSKKGICAHLLFWLHKKNIKCLDPAFKHLRDQHRPRGRPRKFSPGLSRW